MKSIRSFLALLPVVALAALPQALGQSLITNQPNLITIVRESVKVGRIADHANHEAGWPAALEKAKAPDYYIAMVSMTGPSEAWYVTPYASHAAIAKAMKMEADDKRLEAELERLARVDADFISSSQTIQARARPELGLGAFPDLAKSRFNAISILRVRPGHEKEVDAGIKAYGAVRQRVQPDASYRVYQVIAGMPGPALLVFTSVKDFADFDANMAAEMALNKSATPEEMAALTAFRTGALIESEVQRFRVDPRQSYVPQETRAKDPEFWMPK